MSKTDTTEKGIESLNPKAWIPFDGYLMGRSIFGVCELCSRRAISTASAS